MLGIGYNTKIMAHNGHSYASTHMAPRSWCLNTFVSVRHLRQSLRSFHWPWTHLSSNPSSVIFLQEVNGYGHSRSSAHWEGLLFFKAAHKQGWNSVVFYLVLLSIKIWESGIDVKTWYIKEVVEGQPADLLSTLCWLKGKDKRPSNLQVSPYSFLCRSVCILGPLYTL